MALRVKLKDYQYRLSDKTKSVTGALCDCIERLSRILFSLIGGMDLVDMPRKPKWRIEANEQHPRMASVELLSEENMPEGSRVHKKANSGAWEVIKEKHKLGRFWVQMHLINEKLGGKGLAGNLIPGPKTINSQMNTYAEAPIKYTLKQEMPKNYKKLTHPHKPVMWMETSVDYYNRKTEHNKKSFRLAELVTVHAGFHYFDAEKKEWVKESRPVFSREFPVPLPRFEQKTLNMNTASREELLEMDLSKAKIKRKAFKDRLDKFFDSIIIERRRKNFKGLEDFNTRVSAKEFQKKGYKAFIKDIKKLEKADLIKWNN